MTIMRYVWILYFILVWPSSFAALELELTQGVTAAYPLAVTAFEPAISDVIRHDLQNSGRFRLVAGEVPPDHYRAWRKQGADSVLHATVTRATSGRYRVAYTLWTTVGEPQQLLSQSFVVKKRDFRRVAHRISDAVYTQLTGDKGIFSTRIAYVLVKRSPKKPPRYTLEVSDVDGHNPHPLLESSEPIMSPAWSPDATRIAYVSFEHQRSAIYVMDIATGKRRVVSCYPGINGAPAWSPDAQHLAFVLSKSGAPKIYTYDLQRHRLRQMTRGIAIDTEPSWSPDGQYLLFTSDRGGSPQIYRLHLASRAVERVTFSGRYNARASYTPDGSAMILLHRSGGLFNIAWQDLDNSHLIELTRSGLDESPSMAPNGKMVLYAGHYGGNGVLNIISIDGKVKLRLPARQGDVQEPAWSPFRG